MGDVWIDSDLGDDGFAGDEQNPIQTHAEAWTRMIAGDLLWHYTGIGYVGGDSVFTGCPSGGGSWATATQLINVPGQSPVITGPGGSSTAVIFAEGRSYIILDGFRVDQGAGNTYVIRLAPAGGGANHHLRLIRCELHNSLTSGGVLTNNIPGAEVIACDIHDVDDDGLYVTGETLIERNYIYNCGKRAFQIHTSGGVAAPFSGAIARYNLCENCGYSETPDTPTILIWNSGNTNGFLIGNILRNFDVDGTGIVVGGNCAGWGVYNNVVDSAPNEGYLVGTAFDTILRNNIGLGSGSNYVNGGTNTVESNNLFAGATINDVFKDAANRDYRLLANSPARGAGMDLSSIFTQDYFGKTYNPASWDQGAAKYAAALQRLADRGPTFVFFGG